MLRAHTSRRWIGAGLSFASVALAAACAADRIVDPALTGYSLLTPPSASVLVGASVPLVARVVRNGTDTITVGDAIWRSSDTTIASVIAGPALKAKKAGSATISVAWSAQQAEMTLTVQNVPVASVRLVPSSVGMVPGDTRNIVATPLDASGAALTGRTVTWTSSNNSVATVANGTVTAVAVGTASIVATIEGVTATAPVTVTPAPVASVAVTLNAPSIAVGQSVQAVAVARDVRGTELTGRPVTWSSNNNAIATVDATGLVRAVGVGTANIIATIEGVQGQAALATTAAPVASITLQPTTFTINVGGTQQVQATLRDGSGNVLTGRTVTWSSSNLAAATVDGAGLVRGVAAGTTVITATSGGVTQQATATVVAASTPLPSITPATATIYIGGSTTLTAVMRDASGTTVPTTFVWFSGNTSIATVDANGVVTGIGAGEVTITASADGKSTSAQVTVVRVPVANVSISPTSLSLQAGATGQLTATCRDSVGGVLAGRTVTWSSNATSVATVNAVGLVTGVAAGSSQVTATCEGKSAAMTVTVTPVPVASVTVTPATATVRVGSTLSLTATTRDAAGNTLAGRTVAWSSSSTALATVSSTGVVTPVAPGTVTITATSEGRTGTSTVTVQPPAVASVTLSPGALSLVAGTSGTLTATARDASGNPIAGTTFTWSTDDAATATVANGVVTGVRVGSTTVRATAGGVTGSAAISVSSATTSSLVGWPEALPVSNRQAPRWESYTGGALAAGQSYQDPTTNARVWRVTSATVPASNGGMQHMYAAGPVQISRRLASGRHSVLFHSYSGNFWLADVQAGSGVSNYRQLSGPTDAYLTVSFSLKPATPHIIYYFQGGTLVRFNTLTMQAEPNGFFPKQFPVLAGASGRWLSHDKDDRWFVFMNGAASAVYAWNSETDQLRTWTVSMDEPHFDRDGQRVAVLDNAGTSFVRFWDLATDTKTASVAPVVHPAFVRGYFVSADPTNDMEYYVAPGASTRVNTLDTDQHSNGIMHRGDQWIQTDAELGNDLRKQWYLYSSYADAITSLGTWTAATGEVHWTTVGFDWDEAAVGVRHVAQYAAGTTARFDRSLTAATSVATMTEGTFYWDAAARRLYVWAQGGGSPSGRVAAFAASRIHDAIAFVRVDGSDLRLVAHTYSRGSRYETQPHATVSPDGLLVMWTTDMGNGNGRGDVFVAEVPSR